MSKKEDIIETALNLFNRHNYSSVGVDRIISESGVAKMTFYKYFPSKESLIEVCLSRRNKSIQAAIEYEVSLQKEDDYLGKIKAVYFWHLAWFNSDDFHGCMFQKASLEILQTYPSIIKPIVEYREWLMGLVEGLFEKAKVYQPHVLTSMYINILDGMTAYAKVNKDHHQIEECWYYIERLISLDAA
ncbi:MAG: TetR/AcrR family transcriptional regulator [Pseudomonadota bacterium]|uniref:TetR/AcrR family transcriptional regulator n=1 Tax=Acinetobacter venetianus TaxID=52133 RepID=UPI000775E435|nr:TetR/AcrR family transcriptional regulator [Acinetobacter venetianus]KXO81435.1 TetR family transcriptional regulator [Acinetobacter venetianus]MEC8566742.1 TetR/AcrR family transcriptional regulator [Pseudomonadota bacterium]